MKFSLGLFYFLSLFFWTKDISSGISIHALVLWNTGYSQYQTLVHDHNCLHIDPGGTLKFPLQTIYSLCQDKENQYTYVQNDKFHTSYIKLLNQIFPKSKETNESKSFISNLIATNHALISYAHLDKVQFEQTLFRETKPSEFYVSLILPNHGQPKRLTKDKILMLSKFHMLITGSQSRKYENHQSTEAKFVKVQKDLILKNKWGHLIFETQF